MANCNDYISADDLKTGKQAILHIEHVAKSRDANGKPALEVTDTIRGESVTNKTLVGLENLYNQAISQVGYITMDSFEDSATLTLPNEVLRYKETGEYYRWDGVFPKVVAAGSTPASSGGIGLGAWVSVGDASLRSDLLNGGKAQLVGYVIKTDGTNTNVDSALDLKYPNIIGNMTTPSTGMVFDSFSKYYGNHDFRFTNGGSVPKATKRIKKTGNATITLNPAIGSASPLTVDTVAYINPSAPELNSYPQMTEISNITLEGDSGECGLAILQGQNFSFNKVGVLGTKISLWFKDAWMSEITALSAWGQVRHEGGTSTVYKNCFAKVTDPSVNHGAYRLSNLNYSSLISCASDGTLATAYWFDGCHAVNVTSCGAELPSSPGSGYGALATIASNCQIIFDSFYVFPKTGESEPLVAIFDNNNLTFNNCIFDTGGAATGYDFFIHGPNNRIVINGGRFIGGEIPKIGVSTAAAGTAIIVNTASNKYAYKVTSTSSISPTLEPFSTSGTIDSTAFVVFGSNITDVGGAIKDIKYRKDGGTVMVEFSISLNGAGGQTGQMHLLNMPYASSDLASGIVSLVSGLTGNTAPITVSMNRGSTSLDFYKTGDANATTPLTNTDVSPTSVLRGSITYKIETNF